METVLMFIGLILIVAGLIWLVDLYWQVDEPAVTELVRTMDAIDSIDSVAIQARSAMLQAAVEASERQGHDQSR